VTRRGENAAEGDTGCREAEYYQTIEEEFVSRRGGPLTLSNLDWLLMRRWRKAGIPLRVALRGVRDALRAHELSFDRNRPVGSLRYCAHEVEAARERWHHALALGEEQDPDLSARLERLAHGLEERSDLPSAVRAEIVSIAGELRLGAEKHAAPGEIETRLAAMESRLLRRLRRAVGEQGMASLEAEIEQDLGPYRERMPEGVLLQMRDEGLARRLFERFSLPRLTLFHVG